MTKLKLAAALGLFFLFGLGLYLDAPQLATAPAGTLTAVVVEDTAHRTPAIGAVLTDPTVLAYVKDHKIVWKVIDQAEAGPDLANVQFALDAAKNCRLPALVFRTGAGKPHVVALPGTAAACLAVLQKAG